MPRQASGLLADSLEYPGERSPGRQAVVDADNTWFALRPGRQTYVRFTTAWELEDIRRRGFAVPPDTVAVVTVVKRTRLDLIRAHVSAVGIHRRPDTLGEAEASALFAQATAPRAVYG